MEIGRADLCAQDDPTEPYDVPLLGRRVAYLREHHLLEPWEMPMLKRWAETDPHYARILEIAAL